MKNMVTPYAEVLHELVSEQDSAMEIYQVLYQLGIDLHQNPQYVMVLSSPSLENSQQKRAIEELLPKKEFQLVRNTFLHLLETRNFIQLPAILELFCKLFEQSHQIFRVRVTTATPLSPELEQQLSEVLTKKLGQKVFLDNHIDSTCLGGLILSLDNQQYDASLQKFFLQIRQELSQTNILFAEEKEV